MRNHIAERMRTEEGLAAGSVAGFSGSDWAPFVWEEEAGDLQLRILCLIMKGDSVVHSRANHHWKNNTKARAMVPSFRKSGIGLFFPPGSLSDEEVRSRNMCFKKCTEFSLFFFLNVS